MKNDLIGLFDKDLLGKKVIIESVDDQLKKTSQIEHTCHRSHFNFVINFLYGLIAYCCQPKSRR